MSKRPFKLYYVSPNQTEPVEECDEVEVAAGEYKGFQGIVGAVMKDGSGEVKLWPTDATIEKFPDHPEIKNQSHKCWFVKPRLKLIGKDE